jgi:hypothetical protein
MVMQIYVIWYKGACIQKQIDCNKIVLKYNDIFIPEVDSCVRYDIAEKTFLACVG